MVSTYNCIGKVLQWIRKTPQRVATHGYVRVWKSVQATDHSHSKPLVLHLDPLIPNPDFNHPPYPRQNLRVLFTYEAGYTNVLNLSGKHFKTKIRHC